MLSIIERIIFTILLLFTIYGFFSPIYFKYRLIKLGLPENRFDSPFKRIINAITSFFFLTCSIKRERPFTGFIHMFILYGSLTFDTITVAHILEGMNKNYHINSVHAFIADVFSILVLIAVTYFIIRRYVLKPDSYTYKNYESLWIYSLLITVTLTFLLYEGAVISLYPDHSQYSFIGRIVAGIFLNPSVFLIKIFWWVHIINVFVFIVYVPRSKYLHMIAGPVNIALRNNFYFGKTKILDVEDEETDFFGIENITHFTNKDLMDGFACLECGRCQDYCPAYNTEKALSPKLIITDMRDELINTGAEILNKNNSQPVKPLIDRIFDIADIWSCTTCGVCMQVCPVENEHVPKIIGLRQSQVLMESKFPDEFNSLYKGLENQGNPWGINAQTGMDWATGLNISLISDKKETDILVWAGCEGKFDSNAQKNEKLLIEILDKADVDYAFLGNEEKCCGDPARRTGRDELFQMLAMENIGVLQKYKFNRIVTLCPHCLYVLKNEYSDLGGNFDVIHHSELIKELIDKKNIIVKSNEADTMTYHDPCYLGRYNKVYDAPREILNKVSNGKIIEMENNKTHSFCCGAGGGGMWKEESEGSRISHTRLKEAEQTNAKTLVTACSFCATMFRDANNETNSNKLEIKDIAQVVVENFKDG